jgi:hypothetical protein
MNSFFRENYDVCSKIFIDIRKPPAEMNSKKEIENLHDAYLTELQETFSAKLSKDRMYQRPAGFVTD